MSSGSTEPSPLAGRRILVTRERPGELGRLLAERGADVVHVPLIETTDPVDGGAALGAALDRLAECDWLIVTSAAGAERVGVAARQHPAVQLAAVGTTTARRLAELAGRAVDLVPERHTASELARTLNDHVGDQRVRILLAQADRAPSTLADLLGARGHDVAAVTAYATALVHPDRDLLQGVDALVLASGSAATSWVEAVGTETPPIVVAIGPTTADVSQKIGLKVSAVAAEYTLAGLIDALERQFTVTRR